MTIKVWERTPYPDSYVEAVFNRIVTQLPVITGASVTEVETDLFFMRCRDALVQIASTPFFAEVLSCTCDVLDDLNSHDKYARLVQRPKTSLRSIAVVLRLLADITELNWKSREVAPLRYAKRQTSSNVLTSVSGIGSASHRQNYYSSAPEPLPVELVKRAIAVIARLKSPRETMMTIAEIKGEVYQEPVHDNFILLENIDMNCATIMRFVSAANPAEMLSFMQGKITVLFSQSSDESDYVPYLDYLAHIQVIDRWLVKYAEAVLYSMDKIRKPIHLQLLLYFCSVSTRFWLMSNPQDFIGNMRGDSSLPLLASSLFDALQSRLPDFAYANGTSVMATVLLVCTPKTFEEYMGEVEARPDARPEARPEARQKHQPSASKQLQFLRSVVQQVTAKGSLLREYSTCMVTILLLAGSVKKHDPTSAFVRFALRYLDTVFDVLATADTSEFGSKSHPHAIDNLRVEFFVASVTLDQEKYTAKYVAMLKDASISLGTLKFLTGGLRSLSTNPQARSIFNDVLDRCSAELKCLLLRSCKVLNSDGFDALDEDAAEPARADALGLTLTESKSSSVSDASGSFVAVPPALPAQAAQQAQQAHAQRPVKKDSLSSFRINRHKLDMKKHMSFKLNTNSSGSLPSTPTGSVSSSSHLSQPSTPGRGSGSGVGTTPATATATASGNASGNAPGPGPGNAPANAPDLYRDILKNLLQIFRSQPIAYLLPPEYELDGLEAVFEDQQSYIALRERMEQFIAPYVGLYAEDDAEMLEALSHFALGIVERLARASSAQLALFYSFSCVLIMRCMAVLIAAQIADEARTKKLLNVLVLFMEARHKAVEELPAAFLALPLALHNADVCRQTFVQAEKAFMSGFLIPDMDTYRVLKRGIQLMVTDVSQAHDDACFASMNIRFYRAVARDTTTITSLNAMQKKVKRLLLDQVHATPGLTAIWFELYDKWYASRSEDRSTYYLGFIVAIAGVLIKPDVPAAAAAHADAAPDEDARATRAAVLDKLRFVIDMQMDLLVADDFKVRESAREILSVEMNPVCYPYVVEALKARTQPIVDASVDASTSVDAGADAAAAAGATDKDLLLVDQLSLIARFMLQGDVAHVYALVTDLLDAVWAWARIIDAAQDEAMKYKLKLRHAKIGQALDAHKAELANWGALKLRSGFSRVYLDWVESALFRPEHDDAAAAKVISVGDDAARAVAAAAASSKKSKELEMLAFDVGLEASAVLAALLERMPLETPQAIHATELKRSKKVIFGNYFSVLYKILDKFNSANSASGSTLVTRHKVALLVENAVVGLTNLLNSNVDVGFEFALPLNFHRDRKIKLSFLKVFVSIVDKLEVDGWDEVAAKGAAVERAIGVVMRSAPLTLAVAQFCPPSDVDSLALTFLNGDDDQARVLDVLATLVRAEIATARNSSEILRSNSVATRMLALFCKKEGFDYLERTLKPTLSRIAELGDNFEVEKLAADDVHAEANADKLMFYLNEIVNALFASIEYIPNELKFLCSVIYEATGRVFPDAKIYAVGAFMFLRLIAPAIVSPDANGIIAVTTDRGLKRSYIQLAKVLQLMANSSITTIRWPALAGRMNELTILNVQITRFLQAVSKYHAKLDPIRSENRSNHVDHAFFHHLMYSQLDRVRRVFVGDATVPLPERRSVYGALDEALCEAGQPLSMFGYTLSDFATDKSDSSSALYEFMTKVSLKDISHTVRDHVVHETISADGVPTVVTNLSSLPHGARADDAELIMFRFYQVAAKVWDSKFYVVVDCTGFEPQPGFSRRLFDIFEAYTPPVFHRNLAKTFYYNVSQKYFPEVLETCRLWQAHRMPDSFQFASSFDRQPLGIGLSPQTTALDNDARVTFHDVSLYEPSQKRFVPVTVKIGDEFLQIGFKQPTRFKVMGAMKSATLTDVYPIAQLSGAAISTETGVPDEICIRHSTSGARLILASPKKIEIMRTVYFSKSRNGVLMERQRREHAGGSAGGNSGGSGTADGSADADADTDTDRARLETWLGQLVNIDFVGLLSHDEDVRKTSYVLLCSLARSFRLQLGTHFDSSSQVSFPHSNVTFVIASARVLAERHAEYTLGIVSGFFDAYRHCEEHQQTSAIMYIAPFIRHLFTALDAKSPAVREEAVAALVKKFIEVSTMPRAPLVAFHAHIWSQLTLQDQVAEVLVEEAVAACIDREAEGRDWDDVVSLVTLTPTLKITATVVHRLKALSNIPKAHSADAIATHTSWIEITVLVKICVALFFDAVLFTEMFMPDILYIATMFMDIGPHELRTALYKLLLNVFHSALARDDLDPDSRARATLIVNRFHDQRTKLVLGLNRDDTRGAALETDASIVTRIPALEALCDALFDFIHLVGDQEMSNVWRSRWHSFAVKAAFRDDSMLQDRAFLLLGFLSRHGITDMLIYKLLEKIVHFGDRLAGKGTSFTTVLSSVYALSRAVQGIAPTSPYSEKFYWLALTLNYPDNLFIAHAAIQLLGNALAAVDKRGRFINGEVVAGIFKTRAIFASTIEAYEDNFSLRVTPANIDLVIISAILRDLEAPFTKSAALDALVSSFAVRVNNAILRERLTGVESDRLCLTYATILFTVSKNSAAFAETLAQTDLDVDADHMVELDAGVVIHSRVLDFLLAESDQAILTLLKAAVYLRSDAADEASQLRFLSLYKYVGERSERIKWLLYSEVRKSLRTLSMTSNSPQLATLVFDIGKNAILQADHYARLPQYAAQLDALVEKHHLSGIREMHFTKTHPFRDTDASQAPDDIEISRVVQITAIIKRILDSVVVDD